ncbi:C5 protein [Tomato yellow leaf curl Saudi virus]|uniref:C5 protein n=1 Tax=Tomato yellow leaf curl Saudi virus TaxID=1391746 RepID=UPI0003906733|nr:C5 protein [Tomato yellow leaf curl Saudi virus]AGU13649.1 C5 protein [Tomato yellow leaf curl Saudi virus]
MILIFSLLLMIINNMVINLIKSPNDTLLFGRILTTTQASSEPLKNLTTIPQIILNSGSRWLIIIHVEQFSKSIRSSNWTTIPNKPKHTSVSMILHLNVLIHPHFANNVNRLDTKTFPNTMSKAITTCYI